MSSVNLPKGWKTKKLGEVIQKTETIDPTKTPDSFFDYIDVSSVNNQTMSVENVNKIIGIQAPSRARKLIKSGDVIFATVRPTLKRIAIIPSELNNQVCSTGYFVLRPKSLLTNKWLFYYLLRDEFISTMERLQKGASYPAVTDSQVKEQSVSYPILISEQVRITGILDSAFAKIDLAKANILKNLQNVKDVFQSILKQELTPKRRGEYKLIKDLFNIKTGKLNANAADVEGIYPFFTCSRDVFAINKFAFDCEAILLAGNNASGDFNVKYYKGKFNAYQRTYIITVKDNTTVCRLLYYVLENYLLKLKSLSVGANTKFLKLGMIENILFPDFTTSEQYAAIEKLNALKEESEAAQRIYQEKLLSLETLKKSILQKAFNGEL